MLRSALLFLAFAVTIRAGDFPAPFNTGNDIGKKPIPADEAVKLIKLPPGFKATVFAAEPDVQNPIACAWDSRGRLWVAENYTYADGKTKFDNTLRDRIVIFEDTDNDGHFDKRTVFADNLQNLTSIELGYGGVFATAAPYLLFIPDRDSDDKPDAPIHETTKDANAVKKLSAENTERTEISATKPSVNSVPSAEKTPVFLPGTSTEILLDGFDTKNVRHNFVNGLKWGPDGWLYGRHGILATSRVGAPGTPDSQRVPVNVGIWRYHPVRRVIEVVCWGGTNPWGLDWDAHGEGFFTNTVIGHLYHLIPGAHYERMFGEDPNPHIYQLLPQTADHHHFDTGKGWTASRDGKANDLGGGHAHCGCMIYQGDNWPAEYRGKLFTINLHGRRINCERLERSGSSFVAKHEPDFALFGDPWFRGIDLTYGPDGGVYVLDWSDDGECHGRDGIHRESGRIYKITYGEVKKPAWLEKSASTAGSSSSAVVKSAAPSREDPASGRVGVPPAGSRVPREPSNVADAPHRDTSPANERNTTSDGPRETRGPAGGTPTLPNTGDLAALTDDQLVTLAIEGSEWPARIARRLLAERATNAQGLRPAIAKSRGRETLHRSLSEKLFDQTMEPLKRLRVLWTLHAFGLATRDDYAAALSNRDSTAKDEHTIAWAVRLIAEDPALTKKLADSLAGRARRNALPLMRLAYASNLGRFPAKLRSEVLVYNFEGHDEDRNDGPMLNVLWHTLRNSPPDELASLAGGIATGPFPRWATRRLASDPKTQPQLATVIHHAAAQGGQSLAPIVLGLTDAMRGISKAPKPDGWEAFAAKAAKNPGLADQVRELSAVFGDGRALNEIRALALDAKAELASRRQALETLITSRPGDLRATLEKLATSSDLTHVALRGLATFADAGAAKLALENYKRVRADHRAGVMTAFVSQPRFAAALLDAVATGNIPRSDITPYHAQQIAALGNAVLAKRLGAVWGEVRTTPDEKKNRIAELRAKLTPGILASADLGKGRALFTQKCAVCHTLYGEGGTLGPDLTGGGRDNLDYLLENIVDPSAVVPADFKLSIVTLKDGRVLAGFITRQDERTITLRSMTDTQAFERASVEKTETTAQSLMPEGLLEGLAPEEIRDLFGFLMRK